MSALLAALGILVAVGVGFVLGFRSGATRCAKVALPLLLAHSMRAEIAVKALNIIKTYRPDAFTPEADELMVHLETLRKAAEPKNKAAA